MAMKVFVMVRGGVLGEIWPLRERRETLGGNRFVVTAREGAFFLRSSSVEDGAVDRGRFSGGEEIGRGGNGSAAEMSSSGPMEKNEERRGKEVGVGCCKMCRAPWPIVRWRNGFECFRLRASSSESGDMSDLYTLRVHTYICVEVCTIILCIAY